jgi:ATPase family associated with various cellular activities (AAA)
MKVKKEFFSQTHFAPEKLTPLEEISEAFRRFSKKILTREPETNSNNLLFAGILLLVYGCYQNLNKRYTENFSSIFLTNSLPIFQSVSQKLDWETLTEIGLREIAPIPNTNFHNFSLPLLSHSFLETIVVNENANIVSILFNAPWSQIKKQEFVAFFPIENLAKDYEKNEPLIGTTFSSFSSLKTRKGWSALLARDIPKKLNFSSEGYSLFNSRQAESSVLDPFEKDFMRGSEYQIFSWYSDDIPFKLESFSESKLESVFAPKKRFFKGIWQGSVAQPFSKNDNVLPGVKKKIGKFHIFTKDVEERKDFIHSLGEIFIPDEHRKPQDNSFNQTDLHLADDLKTNLGKEETFGAKTSERYSLYKLPIISKNFDSPKDSQIFFQTDGEVTTWQGIFSKSFPNVGKTDDILRFVTKEKTLKTNWKTLFRKIKHPKTKKEIAAGEKYIFPSRLASGFLWPDMNKSEIWSFLKNNSMEEIFPLAGQFSNWKQDSFVFPAFPDQVCTPWERIWQSLEIFGSKVRIVPQEQSGTREERKNPHWLKQESKINELLLQEMRIALPANISPRLFNKNEKDLFSKPVFLQYKKTKFPVLKYLNALLEDFNLEINPSTIQDLEKVLIPKNKNLIPSEKFWVNWFNFLRETSSGLLFWQRDKRVVFFGKALKRVDSNPQIFFRQENNSLAKGWIQKMKGILVNQPSSFYGENQILLNQHPPFDPNLSPNLNEEYVEYEFLEDLFKPLEKEIVPFGGFGEKELQRKFQGFKRFERQEEERIFLRRPAVPCSTPILSIFRREAIPELTPYEWYNFLQLQLESYRMSVKNDKIFSSENPNKIEKEERSAFGGFQLQLPKISVEIPQSSEIFSPFNFINYQPFAMEIFPFLVSIEQRSFPLAPERRDCKNLSSLATPFLFHGKQMESILSGDKPRTAVKKWSYFQPFGKKNTSFLEYRFNFQPWAADSLSLLNETVPLISSDYCKKDTLFENFPMKSPENSVPSFMKGELQFFPLSELFEERWEPLTTSSWKIFYKLFYIYLIQESAKTLYKGYGKEILQSLISVLIGLGFDVDQVLEFLELKESQSGLRIVDKIKRKFNDIAGVDSLLPELGETVWFLKTKGNLPIIESPSLPSFLEVETLKPEPAGNWVRGRNEKSLHLGNDRKKGKEKTAYIKVGISKRFSFSLTSFLLSFDLFENEKESLRKPSLPFLPKGTLIVGPPGTGKTFLVQAVAGEADVPVIVQSASALMELESSRSEALSKLFKKARDLAPCILFIDEIDTLGSSRENVLSDSLVEGDSSLEPSLEFFSPKNTGGSSTMGNFWKKAQKIKESEKSIFSKFSPSEPQFSNLSEENTENKKQRVEKSGASNEILKDYQKKSNTNKQQLELLMQFIVEMDGLNKLSGVALMGATNRPGVLDPALVRPGRFEKALRLELPNKEKRIAILQHYASTIGFQKSLQWDSLGEITAGFTAADISSAMNQSALYVLLNPLFSSGHSLDTIEAGIESISREKTETEQIKWFKPLVKESEIFQLKERSLKNQIVLNSSLKISLLGKSFYLPQLEQHKIGNQLKLDSETIWKSVLFKTGTTHKEIFFSNVLSSLNFKKKRGVKQRSFLSPIAYNQSGKVVIRNFLGFQKERSFLSLLYPEKKRIPDSLQTNLDTFAQRFEFEADILQFHAGKGSESLFFGTKESQGVSIFYSPLKKFSDFSDPFGMSQDARSSLQAFPILEDLDDKKSKKLFLLGNDFAKTRKDLNSLEEEIFFSSTASRDLFQAFLISDIGIEKDVVYSEDVVYKDFSFLASKRDQREINDPILRTYLMRLWLNDREQIRRTNNFEKDPRYSFSIQSHLNTGNDANFGDLFFGNWYRMFIFDPEQQDRNDDWLESDTNFFAFETIKNLASPFSQREHILRTRERSSILSGLSKKTQFQLNDERKINETKSPELSFQSQDEKKPLNASNKTPHSLEKNSFFMRNEIVLTTKKDIQIKIRDYIYQGLVLNAFNSSADVLNNNREILDLVAHFSLRYQKIRNFEILSIFERFFQTTLAAKALIVKNDKWRNNFSKLQD